MGLLLLLAESNANGDAVVMLFVAYLLTMGVLPTMVWDPRLCQLCAVLGH